jgi:hypothetical protein
VKASTAKADSGEAAGTGKTAARTTAARKATGTSKARAAKQ